MKVLSSSGSSGTTIDLVDVDAGTGHVIAHFLHTGTYQTLADEARFTSYAKATTEFKNAIAAFVAAKKYGLTGLQELAEAEAVQWGEKISVVEAIQAVSGSSLMESKEETVWFQDLMLQKVDQAFNQNGGILFTATFFNNIENSKLVKLLVERTTEHYFERISMLRRIVDTSENDVTAPVECVVEDIRGKPLTAHGNELSQPSLLYNDDLADHRAIETPGEVMEAPEPYLPLTAVGVSEPAFAPARELEPEAIERFTSDALGPAVENFGTALDHAAFSVESAVEEVPWSSIGAAKTERTKKENSTAPIKESDLESPAEPAPEPMRAEDNGLESSTFGVDKTVEEELPPPELEREPVNEPETKLIPEPVFQPVPEAPTVDPFAGLSKSQKKKLEKRMKQEAAASREDEAEQRALKETAAEFPGLKEQEGERSTFTKERRASDPVLLETLPEEASRLLSKREPLLSTGLEVVVISESASAIEGSLKVVEPPSVSGIDDPWEWGAIPRPSKKKKKKKEAAAQTEAPPSTTLLPEPELTVEKVLIRSEPEPETETELYPPVDDKYHPDSGIHVNEPEDDDCPLRYEHLSRSGVWSECGQCELYVRGIALKLHSARLPGFKGLGDS